MSLIETLNKLGNRINRWYPDVNHGGCCVYASIVGEELRERGIEVRVIVAAWEAKKNIDKARKSVNNIHQKNEWNAEDIYFNHVGIEFKYKGRTYHYDTDGVNPKSKMLGDFNVYPGRLSVDEAKVLADEREGWNDSFNRRSIPKLRKHIRSYLATVLPQ